jgi:hypothetical protein
MVAVLPVLAAVSNLHDVWSELGWTVVVSKLLLSYLTSLPVLLLASAIVLGSALLVRRTGLALTGCFAVGWLLVTLLYTTLIYVRMSADDSSTRYLLIISAASAFLLGMETVAVGLFHRWLFGGKRKSAPEGAF